MKEDILSQFDFEGNLDTLESYARQRAFISTYKELAIQEALLYKIPVSIKLAQGILESGAGKNKDLILFGVKSYDPENGKKKTTREFIKGKEIVKVAKFRVYETAEEAFRDHSLVLSKSRYTELFDLPIVNYQAWAYGLQSCGYATDPKYAIRLIKIIERYELYRLDHLVQTLLLEEVKK